MINLLKETLEILKEHNLNENDVLFVTCVKWKKEDGEKEVYCSFEEFKVLADFKYDDGFGSNHIDLSLKVVGKAWWLERHEYDGSEWWEFKQIPNRPYSFTGMCKKDFFLR